MSDSTPKARKRHLPTKVTGIYYSENAKGRKVFEVRHGKGSDRRYEVVGTRMDEAKARQAELTTKHSRGEKIPTGTKTVTDAVELWRELRVVRPRTEQTYDANLRLYIDPRFARERLRDIEMHDVLAWRNGLKRRDGAPLSNGSKGLALETFAVILDCAVEAKWISFNPARQIPKGKRLEPSEPRRRIVSPDEEDGLWLFSARFPWLRPIITVALHQALRQGEVAGLQWPDVDFVAGKLHVRGALGRDGKLGPTKSGKSRKIKLAPKAREALLELRIDSDGTGFVFRNSLGGPRQLRDVTRAFEKAVARAALPTTDDGSVCFHSLRHTGISRLANHPGIAMIHVQEFAGHASMSTTEGYVHPIESPALDAAFAEAMDG